MSSTRRLDDRYASVNIDDAVATQIAFVSVTILVCALLRSALDLFDLLEGLVARPCRITSDAQLSRLDLQEEQSRRKVTSKSEWFEGVPIRTSLGRRCRRRQRGPT